VKMAGSTSGDVRKSRSGIETISRLFISVPEASVKSRTQRLISSGLDLLRGETGT
jgi:hypothetical protein